MALAKYIPHKGSWGTPDFGATEWLSGILGGGGGKTNQGGSNLSAPFSSPAELTAGQNLAAQQNWSSTQPTNNITQISPTYNPAGAAAGGGAGGGGGTGGGGNTGPSPEDLYMQWLNQQYDSQNNYINEMESGLGGQKSSMEQVAQNSYDQGYNSQTTAFNTNKGDLEGYQSKSLQDIGDNLRAMWSQGSRVLGSRGAADSSAAGQYNYAISKLGSKQRGDVMQDVSRRLGNLKSTYDTNVENLRIEKDSQIQQISQWYNDALNSVRGMRAELQQQKSEQALNMAIQMLNDARSQAAQRQSLLDSWAVNKAQSLPELQAMLSKNSQGLQPVGSLGAGMNFGGATQNVNNFGFGNQEQDSLNWLQSLMPK